MNPGTTRKNIAHVAVVKAATEEGREGHFAVRKGVPCAGVHLIVVDANLRAMIHRHPPIAADGRISEPITFPRPGRYRVVVDAYPSGRAAAQPGLQLFKTVTVAGTAAPWPLPAAHGGRQARDGQRPRGMRSRHPGFSHSPIGAMDRSSESSNDMNRCCGRARSTRT